jgi:hypothetical protein
LRTRLGKAIIRESVHSCSVTGDSNDVILANVKHSISELSEQISTRHNQEVETETEMIVSAVCKGIGLLDHAKGNLTACVTSLSRLKTASQTLDVHQKNVCEHNCQHYLDNNLSPISLFANLPKIMRKKEESVAQIASLARRFFDLKRELRNHVHLGLKDGLFRGSAAEAALLLCAVIDVVGDNFGSSTIFLFCHKFRSSSDGHEKSAL